MEEKRKKKKEKEGEKEKRVKKKMEKVVGSVIELEEKKVRKK